MRLLAALTLPVALILAGCSGSAPAAPDGPVVEVRDAFIVQPPEGRDLTGGGLQVSVEGGPLTLIGVRTDIARKVEMHTMSMTDGMMQMRQVEAFPVTPDVPLVLERGGNHLMLFGVESLELGDEIDLILTFTDESGTELEIITQADIVPPNG
jgi:periplasmic copper chaperone A